MIRTLAFLLAVIAAAPAFAEPEGAALVGALGVQIMKPSGQPGINVQGSGVYLGNGLVLTAAHVIKPNPTLPTATVVMDGIQTEAKVAAIGQGAVDLALLKIEPGEISHQRRALEPLKVCDLGTAPNQYVVVAAEGVISTSKTIGSPVQLPASTGTWSNVLSTGYGHGSSGGGVFDALKGCLAGIIIVAVSGPGVELTQFVPAPEIAMFLAGKR